MATKPLKKGAPDFKGLYTCLCLAVIFLPVFAGGMGSRPAMIERRDVPYGPHERNRLDFWQAPSGVPAPVIVYIHGGGFLGGDKSDIQDSFVKTFVGAGVSVASINYRFVSARPFPAPQQDGARAIQFLRHKKKDWNIDPDRIALFGGSAGGGIALWLAFREDLADASSVDPVQRNSTRVSGVAAFDTQTTYDPALIKEWVGARAHEHGAFLKCYGVNNYRELEDPGLQELYDEVSPISHLSADDPPAFLYYSGSEKPLPATAPPGAGVHHPVFGLKLKEKARQVGADVTYLNRSDSDGDPYAKLLRFLLKSLSVTI